MSDLAAQVEAAYNLEMSKIAHASQEASKRAAAHVVRDIRGHAVVDTGSMRDSVYFTSSDGVSTYGDAVGTAEGENEKVVILSEEAPQGQGFDGGGSLVHGIHETVIAVAAEHGFFVENGYAPEGHRPPKPFFEPGIVNAEEYYLDELEAL